ncbi:MAG TPA: hypothetical protein VK912_00350 [Longimicrobiales bacterium]|nr:hypothetical protein [Longimicrobiales bacterium]
MRRSVAGLATMMVVLLSAACADDPVAPVADVVDYELASFDVMGDGYGYGEGGMGTMSAAHRRGTGVPVLGRLLAEARAKVVAEQGAEAAQALFAGLNALRQEAHAARQAGDRELFRAKIEAAHAEAARLIAEILGAPRAQDLIDLAKVKLAALEAAIGAKTAAGVSVPRLEQAGALAGELIAAAEVSLAGGDVVSAIIDAARAAHLAHVATYHASRRQHGG